MWNLSFPPRDWTGVPWIRRQILNHWTTREVPCASFSYQGSQLLGQPHSNLSSAKLLEWRIKKTQIWKTHTHKSDLVTSLLEACQWLFTFHFMKTQFMSSLMDPSFSPGTQRRAGPSPSSGSSWPMRAPHPPLQKGCIQEWRSHVGEGAGEKFPCF